ncbi:MAG: hypothetical protein AAGD96_15745 [Chloroflexota bacterium]
MPRATEVTTEPTALSTASASPTNVINQSTPIPTDVPENSNLSLDYGVNLAIVDVKSSDSETVITLDAIVDPYWGMNADWRLTPPNNVLMASIDYPRLYTASNNQEIELFGVSSVGLEEGSGDVVVAPINLAVEPLPADENDFILHAIVELSEVRSHQPLTIDLSNQSGGSVWELSETIQVGGVTYTFTQAKLTGNLLELYSDGINEEGYETVTFYAMTEYEPSPQIAYANGGPGDFSDPNMPFAAIDLGELSSEEVELYFRSSVRTVEPFLLPFSVDDYK